MKRLQMVQRVVFFTFFLVMINAGAWAKNVTLAWDPSLGDVDGYRIYYVAGAPADLTSVDSPTEIDVGNVFTHTFSGLDDALEYSFGIKAYNNFGMLSDFSNIVVSEALTTDSLPDTDHARTSGDNSNLAEETSLISTISASEGDLIGNNPDGDNEIPQGLSIDSAESGLAGVERSDGGSDADNYDCGMPRIDLDYRFSIKLKDEATRAERNVYLILDGYKYPMQLNSGTLSEGADFIYTTRLGPGVTHSFYYIVENSSGEQLWRYPQSEDLPGPVIELLNGKNVVGMSANVNAYALSSAEAFYDNKVYRWLPSEKLKGLYGRYRQVDSGAPVTTGEGYVIKHATTALLPDLSHYGQVEEDSYTIPLKAGWNLISNPYGGNVELADVMIKGDDGLPVDWLMAAEQNLLFDDIFSYLGSDWGGKLEVSSAAGPEPAILVPWVGYWIFVNPGDQVLSLIIDKPLQHRVE